MLVELIVLIRCEVFGTLAHRHVIEVVLPGLCLVWPVRLRWQ